MSELKTVKVLNDDMNSFEDYCKKNKKEFLLDEWDYEKNAPLMPKDVGYASIKKVAWKCSKGHKWEAIISNRTRWSNCPYCSGKKVCKENCLETLFPEVANEWDYEKNGDLTPRQVMAGTLKKVWWICPKGHSYQSSIHSRTHGNTKCPYCANQKVLAGFNDLQTTNLELLKEWDYERNTINPSEVISGTNKKAWWICKEGHSYEASIVGRVRGAGCPFCCGQMVSDRNSLASCDKRVAALWDYKKNAPLTPNDVAVKSSKRFYWICPKGHSWYARVSDLTAANTGCPYCSGKRVTKDSNLEKLFPYVASQWDYSKNKGIPSHYSAHSAKKVWWICPKGHSWEAVIGNRTTNGTGCPFCNNKSTSFPEQAILYYCRNYFTNTVSRDMDAIGKELDVFIPDKKIAIEYDGTRWHQGADIAQKEKEKDALCKKNSITLYRVIESGVKNEHSEEVKCIYLSKNNLNSLEKAIIELLKNMNVTNINVDLKRDQVQIREAYMQSELDNSFAAKHPDIAKEWDFEKNGLLSPEMFSVGSTYKAWWKCEKGHAWNASIGSRTTSRKGCPFCNHRKPSSEYNLEVKYPEIAKQWNYEKNGKLRPRDMLPQSAKKVWWKCDRNHDYLMPINDRTKSGCNCPFCSGRRIDATNNFAVLYPELLKEWDYHKNADLSPAKIGKGYTKKVWWNCPKGHSYQMTVHARISMGQGCIYCARKKFDETNCLATIYPELLKEWDYGKNIDISPYKTGPKSGKKVWWICPKGHHFQAVIKNRANGSKCPYCAGKIAKRVLDIDTGEIYLNAKEAAEKIGCSKSRIIYGCESGKAVEGKNLKYIDH